MDDNWGMSQERAFIENLLCQRFNFFMVFFSIVVAGAIGTIDFSSSKVNLIVSIAVLIVGSVICWLLKSVLKRSQEKLDIILDHLIPAEHPAKIVDERARKGGSRRRFIGELIPTLCCIILTGALVTELVIQVYACK